MGNEINDEKIIKSLLLSDYAVCLLREMFSKSNQLDMIKRLKNPTDENMAYIVNCYIAPIVVGFVNNEKFHRVKIIRVIR